MKQHFKKLSKHTLIYGLGDVIIKAIAFLLIPLYTRHLTPADYGELSLLQAIEVVLPIILSLGFNSAILKVFHDYDSPDERREIISTAAIFVFIIGLPICLLLIQSSSVLARLIGFSSPENGAFFLKLIFISVFFNLFRLIALSTFRAYERGVLFSVINIIHFTLLVSLNVVYVAVLHQKVAGIVQSSVITSFVIFLGVFFLLFRKSGFAFSKTKLRQLLNFGLPLIPGGIAFWMLTLADRYLLKFLSNIEQVGYYEIGYKFGMILSMVLIHPFRTAWLPFMFSIQKDPNAKRVYSSVLTYYLGLAIFIWLGISALGREMVMLTTIPKFYPAFQVIPFIAFANIFYGIYYTVDVGVLVKGKTGAYAIITGIGALLDIGLAFVLIPAHGMMGAAFAKIVAYITLAVLMYWVAQRYYPIHYEISRIVRMLIIGGLLFGATLLIELDSLWISIAAKMPIILLFPVLLLVTGFFTENEKKAACDYFKKILSYFTR